MQETQKALGEFLSQEDPLEKEVATRSTILAWKIPWIEEPDGLQSMGPQRVRHDCAQIQQVLSTKLDKYSMCHFISFLITYIGSTVLLALLPFFGGKVLRYIKILKETAHIENFQFEQYILKKQIFCKNERFLQRMYRLMLNIENGKTLCLHLVFY